MWKWIFMQIHTMNSEGKAAVLVSSHSKQIWVQYWNSTGLLLRNVTADELSFLNSDPTSNVCESVVELMNMQTTGGSGGKKYKD